MHGSHNSHDPPAPIDVPIGVHRRRWAILAVLSTSLMITAVDHTIINVALPRMVADLGATTRQLQWIVDAYTVVFAGLLLTAGALGDRFGRRGALQLGLVVFLVGSVLAATSDTANAVIFGRGVMGVGGALIMPATLSILTNTFADPRERAKAIGVWTGVAGIGVALGPITGGYLLEHFGWSSVFWVNVPLLVIALVAGRILLPRSRATHRRRLDPVGSMLSIVALTSLVYALIEAPEHGWTDSRSLALYAVAATLVAAFVAWEARHPDPMLDVRLFTNPRFSAASVSIMLAFFALAGAIFLITQYLQLVLGYSPLRAGLGVVPAAIALFIGGPAGPHLAARVGVRTTVAIGLAIASSGLALQALLADGSGYLPVGVGQALFGLGLGLAMAPATDSIMSSLPMEHAGVGSAVNDATREVGAALGVAIVGSVAGSVYASNVSADIEHLRLPEPVASAAADNVGAAATVVAGLDRGAARVVLSAAHDGFVDALHAGLWVAAGISATGALVAALWLPARAQHAEPPPSPTTSPPINPEARHTTNLETDLERNPS